MVTKQLITLKRIAEELKINYNTLISCKKYFEEYLIVKNIGRTPKYPDAYIDFFRLVFALKDEGFVMPEIKRIIIENDSDNFESSLAEWIFKWHNDVFNEPTNDLLTEPTNEPTNDLLTEPMNEPTNDLLTEPMNEPTNDLMNERLNDDFTLVKEEILSALPEMITKEIQSISDNHESALSDLTAQINGAITKIFKAITELQLEFKDLHARLTHLEKELGATPAANPVLVELDLEAMQISLQKEKPRPLTQHLTLEFVKASISDGKPDKLSVIQWIQAERERNPSVSYGEMAEMLDGAGIPTLSGKVGWNRGTIRNLVVK